MMSHPNRYSVEFAFVATVMLLSVAGFWKIYVGADADPNWHHHLHVVTNFSWLSLLLIQLRLLATNRFRHHRRLGVAVLFFAPLVVASTALLSVYSAFKGVVSGEGDVLIVQNVMVTLELGLTILLAFILRKRRKLHGSFLVGSAILFMGIALFFTLISFVPGFVVSGPETFDRFQKAGIAAQAIALVVGVLFFVRDRRHGWPLLLVGSFFLLNELIRSVLTRNDLIQPLTAAVGSLSQPVTFVTTFAILCAMLSATGWQRQRVRQGSVEFAEPRSL